MSACHLVTLSILATAAGVLFSCKVGPNYKRPALTMPATWKTETRPSRQQLGTDWWVLFKDPQLTALEEAATKYNPDLQAAMQRVIQGREAAKAVKSQFYPVITLNPSITRTTSGTGHVFGDVTDRGGGHTSFNYRVPFDLTYEIDAWGRVRRAVESANAAANATADAYFVILQQLQADVAVNYFNLRSLDTQSRIIDENVELYREQLRLQHIKEQAGVAPKGDSLQVQTLLESTLAQKIDIRRQRNDVEHALAILTGRTPAELSLPEKTLDYPPPSIPPGLPSELLLRRPDVAQAEQNLIAANADVGVATAGFYPRFSLTASTGLESVDLKTLFLPESRFFTIGPAVSIPIFEGGRLTAELAQAKSRYLEIYANYRSTVLAAMRDVEDTLNDASYRAEQARAQQRAVTTSKEFLRLTQRNAKEGNISQLQLIDADRTLLNNQLTLNEVQTQQQIATVLLIKALGGGWRPEAITTRPGAHALTTLPSHSPTTSPTSQPTTIPIYPVPPATAPSTQP